MARYSMRVFACMLVAALAAACDRSPDVQRETERVRQGAEQAAEEVAAGAERAAEKVAAGAETVDVKAALMADGRVDASRIDVDTSASTRTVVLKGTVPTEQQKMMAEQIARERAEGYTIDNQLVAAARQP